MIKILSLFILAIANIFVHGQHYFQLNSKYGNRPVSVEINGKPYQIDSSFQYIETNYPNFDTISFNHETWRKSPILCNFKPDSSYTLIMACCANIDIVQTWKTNTDSMKIWDYEYDYEKFKKVQMDRPFITFKIINGSSNDSIYAWNVDHSCFPSFKLIDKKGWKYGVPVKCFYWNNITAFTFFKPKENYDQYKNKEGIIEDIFPDNSESLGTIYVRLFDKGRYIVTYDISNKKISLKYDKLLH